MLDDEAAARAERQAPQVMLLEPRAGSAVRRQRNDHVRGVAVLRRDRQGFRIADGLERDGPRRVDVLRDESRRHLQRLGVVVEVALDIVLGQQRLRVHLEREQVADRVRVLAAVQAAQRHAAGRRLVGGGVDLVGEPLRQLLDGLTLGTRFAGRRHEAASQLADRELPRFRIRGNSVRRQAIERAAAGHVVAVVALEAVLLDDRPLHFALVGVLPQVRAAADRCDGADERRGYEELG